METANGLIDAAEAISNPFVLAYTLCVCGYAFRDTDPDRALEAMRRSLLITQDSGNRLYETQFSYWLAGLEAEQGDRVAALDYLAVAIRKNHESGNIGLLHNPLAILAVLLDRLRTLRTSGHHRRLRDGSIPWPQRPCPNSAQR